MVVASARPLFTDDAWWHLALGRAFAAGGPWLARDPLLFDAAAPPSPAAWFFDLTLFGLHDVAGFPGLRWFHAAAVVAVIGLAWSLLRRASGSAALASAGSVAFIAFAAYRFMQLRPHLVTMLFSLLLVRLLLENSKAPSPTRIGLAALLFAVWANAHAAFPVGLLLLGAGAAAATLPAWWNPSEARRARARRLAGAWLAGLAATLINPMGLRSHSAWFAAGSSTPSLGRVVDEWATLSPFTWPTPTLPPTPLAWLLFWGIALGLLWIAPRALAALRGDEAKARGLDPVAVGLAGISLALMLGAVRFLWLGIFPLWMLSQAWDVKTTARGPGRWVLALAPALLAALFVQIGDGPLIRRTLPRSLAQYQQPYEAIKYFSPPIWLARDAQLEGRLYCDYFQGGFIGYWLAPRVRTIVNGTLNVPSETLRAATALGLRRGLHEGESFVELLDRLEIDLFLGIRPPETGHPHRPWVSTTAHLENTPGWIPLFRNLSSALYLRNTPANRPNLERVARYYAKAHVPFDLVRGFEPARVLDQAPEWARDQGLVPEGFGRLEHRARTGDGARAAGAQNRLASLYTALGMHREALLSDRALLETRPEAVGARRRLVWNLMHLQRFEEAALEAQALAGRPTADTLSQAIARAAQEIANLEAEERRALLANLPVFQRSEIPPLLAGVSWPAARTQ